jgi:CubicO group peptidase (beta-lactamase class C family)
MRIIRRRFLSLAAAATVAPAASRFAWSQDKAGAPAGEVASVFPGAQWEAVTPTKIGWSIDGLAEANGFFDTLPPASMVVVDHGHLVVAWGDSARRVKLSSIRKSLLSALYGTPVRDGRINLDDTLEHLGIDDDPPLTQAEKQATLRMLFESRSGVFHSYVGGTPDMRERMPVRGSHPPGAFWYYNNWDFNVLGAVYERQLDKKLGNTFYSEIALPIQMEDFHSSDMYYLKAADNAKSFAKSPRVPFSIDGAGHGAVWPSLFTSRKLERHTNHPIRLDSQQHGLVF